MGRSESRAGFDTGSRPPNEEIEQAFRKIVMMHHPDKPDSDRDKFEEATKARTRALADIAARQSAASFVAIRSMMASMRSLLRILIRWFEPRCPICGKFPPFASGMCENTPECKDDSAKEQADRF